ncbi:MAG: hypothetical protein U9O89_01615, partial [Thermoproteota archaeon]|nr:hypothetical protein [Thermoproteota archaeon]
MRTITRLLKLRRDNRGVSNVIVVVLSLILVVTIVSNVILWSYQMNQMDWEKMRESIEITDVSRVIESSWSVPWSEYTVGVGNHVSGTYEDTQAVNDGCWETFRETGWFSYRLQINNTFILNLSTYPLAEIQTIEIRLRYRTDDNGERWHLKAYNWTSETYSNNGFNSTEGHKPTTGWNNYVVNLTNKWRGFVRDDGAVCVRVHDQGGDWDQTTID